MMRDIWELNGEAEPSFDPMPELTPEELTIRVESLAPMPVNLWTLALIILVVWLAVRDL